MSAEIKPGTWINVKVVKQPKTEAKKKTMVRLFENDPEIKQERRRLSSARQARFHRRGGRPWRDAPARLQIVETKPGADYKLFASYDTVKAIRSLGDTVEVKPA
jgi:hypothetical protein